MKRILLVKLSSMGDVIHNLPVASDLARHFPDASIDWVTEAPYAPLVQLHAAVNTVFPVRLRALKNRWFAPGAWLDLLEDKVRFAGHRYDMVLDTQGLIKSAVIARWAEGPVSGFNSDSAREAFASRWYQRRYEVPKAAHAVARNRLLAARAIGAPDVPDLASCDYGLVSPAMQSANAVVPARAARCVVCLHATSRADKCWPESDWIQLGRTLNDAGYDMVLLAGTAAEFEVSRRIASALDRAEAKPPGALTDAALMLRDADAVVGVDTGLAHLAVALGKPTVGIYLTTQPALTGLYGARAVNLGGGSRATPARVDAPQVWRALSSLLIEKP
jgi:heptosyltransferase-1